MNERKDLWKKKFKNIMRNLFLRRESVEKGGTGWKSQYDIGKKDWGKLMLKKNGCRKGQEN